MQFAKELKPEILQKINSALIKRGEQTHFINSMRLFRFDWSLQENQKTIEMQNKKLQNSKRVN
jgi:hypothetical protein